jgi:hypothetical protein
MGLLDGKVFCALHFGHGTAGPDSTACMAHRRAQNVSSTLSEPSPGVLGGMKPNRTAVKPAATAATERATKHRQSRFKPNRTAASPRGVSSPSPANSATS